MVVSYCTFISGSGSGSGSMEITMDPDLDPNPAKGCGYFGSGSGAQHWLKGQSHKKVLKLCPQGITKTKDYRSQIERQIFCILFFRNCDCCLGILNSLNVHKKLTV